MSRLCQYIRGHLLSTATIKVLAEMTMCKIQQASAFTYHFEYVLKLLGVVLQHTTSVDELQKRIERLA